MNTKPFVLASMLVVLAVPCLAHDTWLLPREPQVDESRQTIVDLTTGSSFPTPENAVKFERIAKGGFRVANGTGRLDRHESDVSSLVMHLTPRGQGTAVLYLTLKPKSIDLDGNDVEEYFDEIGASESLRREWAESGGGEFHEVFTKHAKSYIRVGDYDGEDRSCLRPVGQAMEFIPQSDPTALAVGDELVVKVVRGGDDEIESFPVAIVSADGGADMQRTNQNGMVSFTINGRGWHLVRATELRRQSDGTFKSDMTTMTFFVKD